MLRIDITKKCIKTFWKYKITKEKKKRKVKR